MILLVLNCGSATVKYKVFDFQNETPELVNAGAVEIETGHRQAIEGLLGQLPRRPDAVAHRVVHGGDLYTEPVIVDDAVIERLRELSDLAPLHNPPALEGILAAQRLCVPQVAAFDTAFHQTMPEWAYRYALPQSVLTPHNIRRYGFHGWSHRSVMEQFARITGITLPTIITLHMGNGVSAAAIKDGRCVDTSMGVTPLEGLVMGTRGGDLDPGILIRLQRKGMSLDELEHLLWRESGLKGMAGTNDMRELLERTDDEAVLAIDLFCYRARKIIGAYLAVLGGAEGIVFTGGIGEKSPEIRARIASGLGWFGVEIDPEKNSQNRLLISKDGSKLPAYVLTTNEELLIAKEAGRILRKLQGADLHGRKRK